MAHRAAKLLTGFFVGAVVLLAAALVLTLSRPASPPPPLPQPNGYDDFVKAAAMAADNTPDYATMGAEELRALVRTNAEALKLARVGLGRECQVPLAYLESYTTNISHLAGFKRLAFTFAAEGRLAEMENRIADAMEAYLAVIRLGQAMSRGGLIIDSLVGIAIQSIGEARLEKLALTLNASQCREAVTVLEVVEARREPMETIRAREREWARRLWGFKGQIARLLSYQSLRQSEQKWVAREKAQQIRAQVLLIQLATRAYELEKGDRPKHLADLVPVYLTAIPQNPVTGTNMSYP